MARANPLSASRPRTRTPPNRYSGTPACRKWSAPKDRASRPATGYHTKTYEHIKNWYDTQAWLPKNAVLVNRAAFNALDKATQDAVMKAVADAETRGMAASKAENSRTVNLLKQNGMNIIPPSPQLKVDMKKVGDVLLMTRNPSRRAWIPGQARDDS